MGEEKGSEHVYEFVKFLIFCTVKISRAQHHSQHRLGHAETSEPVIQDIEDGIISKLINRTKKLQVSIQ